MGSNIKWINIQLSLQTQQLKYQQQMIHQPDSAIVGFDMLQDQQQYPDTKTHRHKIFIIHSLGL